jgi:cell division protein FtsL
MSIDLEFAIKKDIRNNPIVREVDVQQKHEFRQTLAVVATVVAMLLFWAWPHLQVVKEASKIQNLRLALQAAEARNGHLRLELATLTAPEQVDQRARKARFVSPTEKDTLIVERVEPARPSPSIVADTNRRAGR